MSTALRLAGICILVPLLASYLTACARNKPSAADVTAILQQSVPGYVVSDLECEFFADRNQEGEGRTSCRGSLAPAQDLYSPLPVEEVQSLIARAGIPQEGAAFFASRHPQQIYRLSVSRGTTTPLTAECTYRRNVDGWQMGCNPSYNNFAGQPLGLLGANPVMQDSAEYRTYIDAVLTDFRTLDAAYRALKVQVERFFSAGRAISLVNANSGNDPVMRIRLTSPISWIGPESILGYQSQFRLEPQIQTSSNRTLCGYDRGTPNNVVRLEGQIDASSSNQIEQGAGPFTAHVAIFEPTAMFGNSFNGCGNTLNWNGTSWGPGSLMALELRSQ